MGGEWNPGCTEPATTNWSSDVVPTNPNWSPDVTEPETDWLNGLFAVMRFGTNYVVFLEIDLGQGFVNDPLVFNGTPSSRVEIIKNESEYIVFD